MKHGFLSDYFKSIAVKKLSIVETNPARSNQHEFNGSAALRQMFGDDDRRNIPAKFIWMGGERRDMTETGVVSWYDARRNHPSRTEYRLYYPANEITSMMQAEDTMFIALLHDETVAIIIVPSESLIKNQLLWLFSIKQEPTFESTVYGIEKERIDFSIQYILDELGIVVENAQEGYLDGLVEKFGMTFPNTREFSLLARDSLPEISPEVDCADAVIIAWLEREEALFRRLERRIVSQRLENGFMNDAQADVDGFISFSLSVQNRRKARAGQSLENHLEALFQARSIFYSRGAVTENRNRPDFLFPGARFYHDPEFPPDSLTMLGAKSTLKDRWRQVLAEADRISCKHLLTLEPAISENQTSQMHAANLKLVIPEQIHKTYRDAQHRHLVTITSFLNMVKQRQENLTS